LKDDNKPGKSIEDRQFENIMENGMVKNRQGNWEAPLPFKPDRPLLPNNRELALKRAKSLEVSLMKDGTKKRTFLYIHGQHTGQRICRRSTSTSKN
jgi:hypothetical protein